MQTVCAKCQQTAAELEADGFRMVEHRLAGGAVIVVVCNWCADELAEADADAARV